MNGGKECVHAIRAVNKCMDQIADLEQLPDHFTFVPQVDWTPICRVQRLLPIDPELLVDGRGVVFRSMRLIRDVPAISVATTNDLAAGYAGAGEDNRGRVRPVIAALKAVQPRSTAKFGDKANKRLTE